MNGGKEPVGHTHEHGAVSGRKLFTTIILNFIITAAEVIGGLFSGSLALLSDALHNFSDAVSLIISYFAYRLSRRASTIQRTYGFKRAEILAALFNSSVLIVIIFFLFREAYFRIVEPTAIRGGLMMAIALIGLAANLLAVMLLRKDARGNLNIRSAYLHLLADTFSSVAVIIGALFIQAFHIYLIDPILTIVIGLYILRESFAMMKQTVNILMQSTPDNVDIMKIKCALEELPEVTNLHHVHVWQVNDRDIHFEGHIDVCEDFTASRIAEINSRIEKILLESFGINHVTIQIEYGTCTDKDIVKTC
jgi:cobalt-zinc-cadmium efflux system protein